MGESTAIEWTDATFNPWWGCTKVSPACDHCYAEREAHRYQPDRILWGPGSTRRVFGEKHWNEPLRWARMMPAKLGRRPRVFCASMADVFDNEAPGGQRERLWDLIARTPELDWLLLTKRIGNAKAMLPWGEDPWPHVWLGSTVVTQAEVNRDVPKLLETPAAIRFLSIEPMLEPLTLVEIQNTGDIIDRAMRGTYWLPLHGPFTDSPTLQWIIVGGESGPGARPLEPGWALAVAEECREADVAFFFKQGSAANWPRFKDFETYPPGLKLRQFPVAEAYEY